MGDENKAKRTLQEIQQDYGTQCARAGELQYRIFCLDKDISMLKETLASTNSSIRDLNLEAATSKSEEVKVEEKKEESK